jgi:hypothetical protein
MKVVFMRASSQLNTLCSSNESTARLSDRRGSAVIQVIRVRHTSSKQLCHPLATWVGPQNAYRRCALGEASSTSAPSRSGKENVAKRVPLSEKPYGTIKRSAWSIPPHE